jgi:Caspase domain
MSAGLPDRERIALVVGVNSCVDPSLRELKNAVNDARAVADALKKQAGCKLVGGGAFGTVEDPTFVELLDVLLEFKREIDTFAQGQGCLAGFYYSGHGLLAQHTQVPSALWRGTTSCRRTLTTARVSACG